MVKKVFLLVAVAFALANMASASWPVPPCNPCVLAR